MPRILALVVLCISATAAAQAIRVGYDVDHLDLDKHVLQFTVSRPIATAELVVIGDDGKQLDTETGTYDQDPAGKWLAIAWKQPATTTVLKLQLHVVAADGRGTRLELVPWSVTVEHVDVNFATNSAAIERDEANKLDASLDKIGDIVKRSGKYLPMQLYVAGHTDTVGPSAKNRHLSLERAHAIAAYFRKHGLALPIAYAGFGEDVLKVKTADETDEPANRRADYVLGPAAGAPPFKGAYLAAHADWKQLR
ncbi:MAG TPA: OmpA family protein [Kofleriaceae bacterium]